MSVTRVQNLRRYRDIAGLLWRHRPKELIDPARATDEKAQQLAHDLEQLGPTFIKLGQLLSTRADLMPAPYLKALAQLQDHVKPFDVKTLQEIVERELGVKIKTAFSEFSEKPLAAASLGQVHRASLRDGRPVVLKVLRPGIRQRVDEDLAAFEGVASMLDNHTVAGRTYEFGLMLDEFKASLLRELDYLAEAKNLLWLHESLAGFPTIVVPRPIRDFTTSSVLTMEYIGGSKITSLSGTAHLEIDGDHLAEELFRAYLKQILVDGMFHADPHPGNVLLTNDGRVGLIDLGMVAYLSPTWRDGLFRLLLAVAEGRSDEVADVCLDFGDALEGFDERVFRKSLAQIVARQQNASVDDIEVGTLVMEISQASTAAGMRVPSELTMLGKTLLNLDQIGRTLSPHFRPNDAIRRHASTLMQQRVKQQVSPAHLFQKALEVNELVQRLPTRINRLFEDLSHNRLKLKVDVIDEKVLIDGMQKVANRITVGVILAALIIGSAMMMKVETSFRLFGYPGFAILFFMAAALGGVILVADVLFKDEAPRKRHKKPRRMPADASSVRRLR